MSAKQKILVVDDESKNQRIILEVLDDQFETRVAGTGDEALKVIEEFEPDLILLDIMMPGTDGLEVCRRVRANPKFAFTKIILVSGKAMAEERLKGYEAGANDYMTKPFIPEELLAKTKVFMSLTRAERDLAEMNRQLDEKVKERTRQLMETQGRMVNAAKMAALGEMAGGMAHEINTPLGSITSLVEQITELINEPEIDRALVADMAETTRKTAIRISTIIAGLLAFSREASKDHFDLVPVNKIIQDSLSLCRERLKHADVKVIVEPIAADLSVHCQPVQVSQVLMNLIGNSCDAIAPLADKWIKISATRVDAEVRILITDSGAGIPKDIQDKMFQPFFTTKDIGKGTGLGLSVSKGIMESHRGTLNVDPASPNTCFVLAFPKEAKARAS